MFSQSDHHDGQRIRDSAMRRIFARPDLTVAWRSRLSAEFGVAAPVWQDDEGTQLATNLRAHLGISLRW